MNLDIPQSLRDRVEAIALRSNQVEAGIADADNGDFASDEEIRTMLNRYQPKREPPFSP